MNQTLKLGPTHCARGATCLAMVDCETMKATICLAQDCPALAAAGTSQVTCSEDGSVIGVPQDWTAEQIEDFRRRWAAMMDRPVHRSVGHTEDYEADLVTRLRAENDNLRRLHRAIVAEVSKTTERPYTALSIVQNLALEALRS